MSTTLSEGVLSPLPVQNRDSLFGVRVDQEGGLDVLNRPWGHLLVDAYSFGLLTLSPDHIRRQDLPVQGFVLCFQSGMIREGFDFCVIWIIGWRLQSWLLSCFNIVSNSFRFARTRVMSTTYRSKPLSLPDTICERVYLADSRIVRFQDLENKFSLLPTLPAKMWQQLLGHMSPLKRFFPMGQLKTLRL